MSAARKIDIAHVEKRFATDPPGTPPVLGGITLTVAENEFVVLLGRSGCGKTTLLNIIAGLEHASTGTVRVDDAVVTRPGGGKGMVFQQSALFPWLTAQQNVEFAARNRSGRMRAPMSASAATGAVNAAGREPSGAAEL